MNFQIRRLLLAGFVLVVALPFIGCGGEPLKPTPDGVEVGPPPKDQRERFEHEQAKLKELREKKVDQKSK
jgi:hypothetical protein